MSELAKWIIGILTGFLSAFVVVWGTTLRTAISRKEATTLISESMENIQKGQHEILEQSQDTASRVEQLKDQMIAALGVTGGQVNDLKTQMVKAMSDLTGILNLHEYRLNDLEAKPQPKKTIRAKRWINS